MPSLSLSEFPYEVELDILFGNNGVVELDKVIELDFLEGKTLRIEKQHLNPREIASNIQRLRLLLKAFSTPTKAENAGKKLTFSVLWLATSKKISIKFQKMVGEYPFSIRDRNQSRGFESRGEGFAYRTIKPEEFKVISLEAFNVEKDQPDELVSSMELYSTARFETSERAKFIGLMTALEAVCKQKQLGAELDRLIDVIKGLPEFKELFPYNQNLIDSLASRINELRRESVRQSIIRNLRELDFEDSVIRKMDEVYGIRSKIIHEGLLTRDLHEQSNFIEIVLRKAYSKIVGLQLNVEQ